MRRVCPNVRRSLPILAAVLIVSGAAGLLAADDPPKPPPPKPDPLGIVLPESEPQPQPQQPTPEQPVPPPVVPKPTEVALGPGDEVQVIVYRHDELTRTLHVPESGVVFFPLVGELDVKNMGLRDLRKVLTERLAKFIMDPQVSLEMKVVRGQKILVLGEVKAPGVFHIQEPTSAIEAITLAGGFTNDASMKSVFLVRDGTKGTEVPAVTKLDMKALLKLGAFDQNPVLKGGEMLYVTATPMEMTARFFDRVWRVVRPLIFIEQGIIMYPDVVDTLHGENVRDRVVVVPGN